jgi:hypothetical protein
MSEPADISLPLPSSDLLLMKDTKMAAVSTVVIDAKTIEVIAYNIAATAQIQPSLDPSLMKYTKMAGCLRSRRSSPPPCPEFADGADDHPSAACHPGPSNPSVRGHVRRRKLG